MTINNKGLARKGWFYWNESSVKNCSSIHWRESLVPAAAVIPAPIAYTRFVAVEKLVVENRTRSCLVCLGKVWLVRSTSPPREGSSGNSSSCLNWWLLSNKMFQIIYCEKMRALQAGIGASQECYLNRLAWDNKIRLCAYFVGFDVHNNEEWR